MDITTKRLDKPADMIRPMRALATAEDASCCMFWMERMPDDVHPTRFERGAGRLTVFCEDEEGKEILSIRFQSSTTVDRTLLVQGIPVIGDARKKAKGRISIGVIIP